MILNQALIVLFRSGVGKLQSSSQIHSAAYFLCLACELRMDFSELSLLGAAWCLSPPGALPLPFSKGPSFTSNFLNFSYSLKKKNGFYILKFLLCKRYTIFCGMWKLYEIAISVPINNILSEHSHAHSFAVISGCFPGTAAELNSCHRDCIAFQSLQYLLSGLVLVTHYPLLRNKWPENVVA